MHIALQNIKEPCYDLCIVGSGPAGIITALEYQILKPGARILLAEFGGDGTGGRNRLDDTIEIRNPVNHHLPYDCTNKELGGSSATWGGRCVMYDPIDFMDRPIRGQTCTWDGALLQECRAYLDRAGEYFECGRGQFNLHESSIDPPGRIAEGFREGVATDSMVERWSRPTRFGRKYARELSESRCIDVVEGAEAFALDAPDEKGQVKGISIRDVRTGGVFKVNARHIVLAAGGQETTRLLLKNPQVFANIGSPPPSLGKYYQGHVSGKIASVRFYGDPARTDYGFARDADGIYLRRRFQFPTDVLLEHNLLNIAIWLDNPLYVDPGHRNGAMSFMYLAMMMPVLGRKLAPPAIAYSITKGKVFGIRRHLWNVIKDFPKSFWIPFSIFVRRYCYKRKLPGVFLYSAQNRYALHFHAEQLPVAENRMELTGDGKTLVIKYEITDADADSVFRAHEVLDSWLRECGCGELEYWYPPEERRAAIKAMSKDGLHQVGTTRIAVDSKQGVVDRNLRVWGTTNLHVCSSSAFPTSGQANPTFLLGAFAIRLARHLAENALR